MNPVTALALLAVNFFKNAVLSGLSTARLILIDPGVPRGGLTRMDYGDLSDTTASLLAGLLNLTPGTTVVEIDVERHEFLLHLLDLSRRDDILAGIQGDFVTPLRALGGRRS